MRKVINVAFQPEELVCLKVSPEKRFVISGYLVRGKSITYGLADEVDETWHQECEIERIKGAVL